MTAAEFANLVQGRQVGRDKWTARCPAHEDRSPSLSISAGRDGRVLVYCFGGCTTDAILSALQLGRRDLFQGPPPSPAQRVALEAERNAMEKRKHKTRVAARAACDVERKWEAVVNTLGDRLAHAPDDAPEKSALARLFHQALDKKREAELATLAACEWRETA